jgi:hypothetical protein
MSSKEHKTLGSFSEMSLCLAGQKITWTTILRSGTVIITDGFKQSCYREIRRFTYSPQRSINGIRPQFFHSHHYRKLRSSLRYAERLLCTVAKPFPKDRFGSIEDLCFAAVAEFSCVALSSVERGIGPGAVSRPLEAQYQDEFYRACRSAFNIHLTSEWSGSSLVGRVDFRIKDMKWVIECVRDGDKIDEHIERFQQGGKYHKWIMSGEIKEYIILDFRTSKPRKARSWLYLPSTFDEC